MCPCLSSQFSLQVNSLTVKQPEKQALTHPLKILPKGWGLALASETGNEAVAMK